MTQLAQLFRNSFDGLQQALLTQSHACPPLPLRRLFTLSRAELLKHAGMRRITHRCGAIPPPRAHWLSTRLFVRKILDCKNFSFQTIFIICRRRSAPHDTNRYAHVFIVAPHQPFGRFRELRRVHIEFTHLSLISGNWPMSPCTKPALIRFMLLLALDKIDLVLGDGSPQSRQQRGSQQQLSRFPAWSGSSGLDLCASYGASLHAKSLTNEEGLQWGAQAL